MKHKMRIAALAATLLPLAACGPAGVPADAVAVVTPLSLGPPPIYSLLGYRQELKLTSEQIAALDSIAQAVQEENRALVEELRRSSEGRRSRTGVLVVMPEGEPVLAEIRANHREAGDAIAALLDEEQEAEVCELFDRSDRRGDGSEERRGRGATGDDERWLQPAGWPWCGGGEVES